MFRFIRASTKRPAHSQTHELSDRETITRLYQLLLGRPPESTVAVQNNLNRPLADVLHAMLASDEFRQNVVQPILAGSQPRGALFDAPPGQDRVTWAAERLPVSGAGRDGIEKAGASWISLFRAIFRDDVFAAAVKLEAALDRAGLVEALERPTGRIEGQIEEVTPEAIRGWALSRDEPDHVLELQLWLDGTLQVTASPDRFRRDVQDRFGGSGVVGFAFRLSTADGPKSSRAFEIRDARTGSVVGSGPLSGASTTAVPLLQLRDEVATLRSGLERIEAALREVDAAGTVPVESYDVYAARHYGLAGGSGAAGRPHRAGHGAVEAEPLRIAVVVDLAGADPRTASLAAESVLASHRRPHEILFLTAPDAGPDGALIDDVVRRAGWSAIVPVRRLSAGGSAGQRWSAALRTVTAPHALLLTGNRVISADGLGSLAAALALSPGSAFIYGDEDAAELESGRRTQPVFRSAFDADLLLQAPSIDGVVLVETSAFLALEALAIEAGPTAISALALALHGTGARLTHVARVLSTWRRPDDAAGGETGSWRGVVEAFLNAQGEPGWEIRPHRDPFVSVPGALDIRWPSRLAGVSATVIIPTRDQPDLLRGALDSLDAAREQNRTAMEIVIVDNGSVEPETHAVLSRAVERGAQVVRDDGPFNWALLNNMAAEGAAGDVLIFLNDDVRVIAPDWLDRLCELALRSEVGAVGTRLHYADGSIQHAGILIRHPDANPIHDGVGADAHDPGYLNRHALVRRVLAVTGACLATRSSVFRETGGFDSARYPVEANDIDYCLRINDRGLKVLYTPHACLSHLESMSRGFSREGEKLRRSEAAMRMLAERWGDRFRSDPYFNAHFDRLRRPLAFLRPPPPLVVN